MTGVTISAEWCEKFAAGSEGMSTVLLTWDGNAKMCAALRLAARALRAKEWCETEGQLASDEQESATTDAEAWRAEGREHAMRQIYDILTGGAP